MGFRTCSYSKCLTARFEGRSAKHSARYCKNSPQKCTPITILGDHACRGMLLVGYHK